MTPGLKQQQFLHDIAFHEMTVIRDEGVSRHLRFKQPDSINGYFDLITWPGSLCYTGDMGTYVFQRSTDMFGFFRNRGRLDRIDHNYWAEKIQAADRAGVRKFSLEKFNALVRSWVDSSEKDDRPDEDDVDGLCKHAAAYAELRSALDAEVLNVDDNSIRCYDAASEFRHDGDAWQEFHGKDAAFEFSDVWDGFDYATTEYTVRFMWCCYALAWGIEMYDNSKKTVEDAPKQ